MAGGDPIEGERVFAPGRARQHCDQCVAEVGRGVAVVRKDEPDGFSVLDTKLGGDQESFDGARVAAAD